ncbi:MAG: heavy-metal-associated domain-containing protein [Chthoniobacter sp.]|nr:heavy-metal-associated domain-containing protein [Chthoniobacter sp.]
MSDESPASVPPELQVEVDLELTVDGLRSAVEHQKVEAALVALPGVQSVSCSENTVAIRYDPEKVTKAKLSELIAAAGFSISRTASASPTPTIESQIDTSKDDSSDSDSHS